MNPVNIRYFRIPSLSVLFRAKARAIRYSTTTKTQVINDDCKFKACCCGKGQNGAFGPKPYSAWTTLDHEPNAT
jgi:hypothetical protein